MQIRLTIVITLLSKYEHMQKDNIACSYIAVRINTFLSPMMAPDYAVTNYIQTTLFALLALIIH